MRQLTREEAFRLITPGGTNLLGPRGKGQPMIYGCAPDEIVEDLMKGTKIMLEPRRKVPTGFQVVLYSGKKILAYLDMTAEEAERRLAEPEEEPEVPEVKVTEETEPEIEVVNDLAELDFLFE